MLYYDYVIVMYSLPLLFYNIHIHWNTGNAGILVKEFS